MKVTTYIGMRDFVDLFDFSTPEEFENLCAMVVDSEREAGRRAQLNGIGSPAERLVAA